MTIVRAPVPPCCCDQKSPEVWRRSRVYVLAYGSVSKWFLVVGLLNEALAGSFRSSKERAFNVCILLSCA